MSTATRTLTASAASALLLFSLTSCVPSAAGTPGDVPSGPVDASALDTPSCDDVTTAGWEEFADPALTTVPERGAKFGNGSATLDFVYADNDDSRYPTYGYQLAYIQGDGGVIPMGGNNFYDVVDGAFSTSDEIFESNADGRYGFMSVSVTQDPSIDDANNMDAATTELGIFCIYFVVAD